MKRALSFITDRWLTLDPRTLAVFRVFFGLVLIGNLYDRVTNGGLVAFYSDEGVLRSADAIAQPFAPYVWTPLWWVSSPFGAGVALTLILAIYVLYTVGLWSKVMRWLAFFALLSLQNRALLMQNGGHVVTHIVALWGAFLPVGEAWSVDDWLRKKRGEHAPRQTIVSFAFLFICINFAAIYFFNALHKQGPGWHVDGSAVHWVLWQNRIATSFAGFLRMHEPAWFSPLATRGTLVMEWALPVLILSPVFQKWTRAVAVAFVFALHGGISMMLTLGPFSYAMMSFSLLLITREHWTLLEQRWPKLKLRTGDAPPEPSVLGRRAELLSFVFSVVIMTCVASQLLMENWGVHPAVRITRRPEWMSAIILSLQIPQGWSMFAPDAPHGDMKLVADARLKDGSHVDVFTLKEPDFDAPKEPLGLDAAWCEYQGRMRWKPNIWPAFRDYAAKLHVREGWPESRAVESFDVYEVTYDTPPPGATDARNVQRRLLFRSVDLPPAH